MTTKFRQLLSVRLVADEECLSDMIINGPSLGVLDLHILSQLKGQIQVWRALEDLKEFLVELTEEGVIDAEYADKRSTDTSESEED